MKDEAFAFANQESKCFTERMNTGPEPLPATPGQTASGGIGFGPMSVKQRFDRK